MSNLENKYNEILKKHFGYSSLKKEQFDIISKIVNEKRDVCAILNTGFGKSLCYQLPHLITKKCVIVISPLIALMEDQRTFLQKVNIPVVCLNSTCSKKNKEITHILNGEYKIIYTTPETLEKNDDFLQELYKRDGICMVAIDESHCISSFGCEFRHSYRKLNIIKKLLPKIPIFACTATASKCVRNDIIRSLNLDNPYVVIGNFDRPNLYISISPKSGNIKKDLGELLEKYKNEYIIIYCKTHNETEKTARDIKKIGIQCFAYHAGLSSDERNSIQKAFIKGEFKCIVSTICFGLGINIPNVRLLLHYNCPKNLESYYQEIGRAGRDNLPCECYLFYSSKDFVLNRHFLNEIQNEKYKQYQEEQIKEIEKYVYSHDCRRKILLGNLDDSLKIDSCNNCDNCKKMVKYEKINCTIPTYKIMSLLTTLKYNFGTGTLINILRASKSKNIHEYIKKLEVYGIGINQSAEWWKEFFRILLNNNYIKDRHVSGFGAVIEYTNISLDWFNKFNNIVKNIKLNNIDNIKVPNELNLFFEVTTEFKNVCNKKVEYSKSEICAGTRWTENEDALLLNEIKTMHVKDIAEKHNRTTGAIRSRLKVIVIKLYDQKKSFKEIIEITGLSQDQIDEILEKYGKYHLKNNKPKTQNTPQPQPETVFQKLKRELTEIKKKKSHVKT